MKANKQTGHHLDQLLSQTVLKGEGQHNRAAGYKAKQKHTQKKENIHSHRWRSRRHVSDTPLKRSWGFPWLPPGLMCWLCGRQRSRVERPDGSPGTFFFFFKGLDPPFRVRITPFTATPVQKRREEEILGNRRGKRREQQSSFVCCTDCGGWKNQCVILHSWKEK